MRVAGQDIPQEIEALALQAMRPGAGIDYFESWDVARVLRSFALHRGLDPHRLAGKLLQRERKAIP